MFNLGAPEMIFILILALLIFGPKRLPQLGRTLGKAMGEFRRATTELQRSINLDIEEVDRERERQRAVSASAAARKEPERPSGSPTGAAVQHDASAGGAPDGSEAPAADPLAVPRSPAAPGERDPETGETETSPDEAREDDPERSSPERRESSPTT